MSTSSLGPPQVESTPRGRRTFAVGLALVLLVLFLWMTRKLIAGVLLGIVLWSMTAWMYRRFLRLAGGRRAPAAGLTVAGTVLLVIVPAAVLVVVVVVDASNLVDAFRNWIDPYRPALETRFRDFMSGRTLHVLGFDIRPEDVSARLEQVGARAAALLLALSERALNGLLGAILFVFVMLYTQFFFCLDGDRFLEWLARLLPLEPEQSRALFDDFFATAKSTLKTLGALGAIQGGMGGLAFWVVGIPAPMFWAVIMALASAIPSVGAQLVLVPAGILLIVIGKTWAGIGLLVWSLVFIAAADNLVRPILVGRDVNLHEVVVLVSTLGGAALFGVFGLILGPVVAALLKASLQIYAEVERRETSTAAP